MAIDDGDFGVEDTRLIFKNLNACCQQLMVKRAAGVMHDAKLKSALQQEPNFDAAHGRV